MFKFNIFFLFNPLKMSLKMENSVLPAKLMLSRYYYCLFSSTPNFYWRYLLSLLLVYFQTRVCLGRFWKALSAKDDISYDSGVTMRIIRPLPAAILLIRTALGNAGSLIPVIGFFSRYGAFAANSGLGRSSSS